MPLDGGDGSGGTSYAPRSPNLRPSSIDTSASGSSARQEIGGTQRDEGYTPRSPRLGYFSEASKTSSTSAGSNFHPSIPKATTWGVSASPSVTTSGAHPSTNPAVNPQRRTGTYQPPILELNKSPEYSSYGAGRRHSAYVPPIPVQSDGQAQGGYGSAAGSVYNSPAQSRTAVQSNWTSPRDSRGYPVQRGYSLPRAALNYQPPAGAQNHSQPQVQGHRESQSSTSGASTISTHSTSATAQGAYQPPPTLSNPLRNLKLEGQEERDSRPSPYNYHPYGQNQHQQRQSTASYNEPSSRDTEMSGIKVENGNSHLTDIKMPTSLSPSGSENTLAAGGSIKTEVNMEGGNGLGPSMGIEVKTKFPVARIKRIMQADEEVGKVAQVTPVAVSKALELFMISLITRSARIARESSSKRVTAHHLKKCIEGDEQFDFLGEIVAKVPDAPEGDSVKKGRGKTKKEEDSDEEEVKPKRKRGARKSD